MKYFILSYLLLISFLGISQSNDKTELYKNYREDQFYASITYNILNLKPDGLSQSGFSTGFHFGFIRDMPINADRDFALGLGLGLSSNSYNQNLLITEDNKEYLFEIINEDEINVSQNKFTTYLVELPFEIRWRTSTATDYNFWRIYAGFKVGYVFYNSTKFRSNAGDVKLSNIDAFNQLQYGLTLSVGYGTWNFHAYYGLNPIFNEESILNGEQLDIASFKVGLMFYIL